MYINVVCQTVHLDLFSIQMFVLQYWTVQILMPVVLWFIYNIYIYWIKKHLYKKHGIRILCCRMLTSNFVDINSVISAILTLKWQSKHACYDHYMMSCVYCQRLSMISVRRQYALQHVKGYNSIDNMMATYLINLFTTDGLSNKLFPLCLYIMTQLQLK